MRSFIVALVVYAAVGGSLNGLTDLGELNAGLIGGAAAIVAGFVARRRPSEDPAESQERRLEVDAESAPQLFERSWEAMRRIRFMAADDRPGGALLDDNGALERGVAVIDVLGNDDAILVQHAHIALKATIELLRDRRIELEDIWQVMGVPAKGSSLDGHGLAAMATQELVRRPEIGGRSDDSMLPISPPEAVAEMIAWYATLFTRLEQAGVIQLPDDLWYGAMLRR